MIFQQLAPATTYEILDLYAALITRPRPGHRLRRADSPSVAAATSGSTWRSSCPTHRVSGSVRSNASAAQLDALSDANWCHPCGNPLSNVWGWTGTARVGMNHDPSES